MKKWVSFISFFILIFTLSASKEAKAQFTMHTWTDSVAITTTTTTLTATVPYQQVTFYTDSVDAWIKWNTSKTWIRIFAGTPYSLGSSDKLVTLYVRSVTGSGVFYVAGLKTSAQSTARSF